MPEDDVISGREEGDDAGDAGVPGPSIQRPLEVGSLRRTHLRLPARLLFPYLDF